MRSVWSAALVLGALALPGLFWALAYLSEYPRAFQNIATVRLWTERVLVLSIFGAAGTIAWARRAVRSDALKRSFQIENFLFRAPLSAKGFWTRPEVAALLAPPRRAPLAPPSSGPSPATEAPTLQR